MQSQGTGEHVQDGTLIVNKSQSRFVTSASDWKLFSKEVPKKLQQFYDDGYKIVVFRQGLMSVVVVLHTHVLPLLLTAPCHICVLCATSYKLIVNISSAKLAC